MNPMADSVIIQGVMEHQAKGVRRIVPWLYGASLAVAILAAGAFWIRSSFHRYWTVPHAIYATGQIVNLYHEHKARHGTWPAPGQSVEKDVSFVRSYVGADKVRADIYRFGGGLYVIVYVKQRGLEVYAVGEKQIKSILP